MTKKKRYKKSGLERAKRLIRPPAQLGLHLDFPAKTTPTDFKFTKILDEPEWKQVLFKSVQVGNWANWAIGACLVRGEEWFGEDYTQAVMEAGISPDRATACKYTYEQIPDPIRIKELSWSHHRVVASLEDVKDRAAWLVRCLENDWTVAELTQELQDAGLKRKNAAPAPEPPTDNGAADSSPGPAACAACGENEGTIKVCGHCLSELCAVEHGVKDDSQNNA